MEVKLVASSDVEVVKDDEVLKVLEFVIFGPDDVEDFEVEVNFVKLFEVEVVTFVF